MRTVIPAYGTKFSVGFYNVVTCSWRSERKKKVQHFWWQMKINSSERRIRLTLENARKKERGSEKWHNIYKSERSKINKNQKTHPQIAKPLQSGGAQLLEAADNHWQFCLAVFFLCCVVLFWGSFFFSSPFQSTTGATYQGSWNSFHNVTVVLNQDWWHPWKMGFSKCTLLDAVQKQLCERLKPLALQVNELLNFSVHSGPAGPSLSHSALWPAPRCS